MYINKKKINDKIYLLTIGHILSPRKTWVSRLKSTLPLVSSENLIMILLSSKPLKFTVSQNTLSTIKILTPTIPYSNWSLARHNFVLSLGADS